MGNHWKLCRLLESVLQRERQGTIIHQIISLKNTWGEKGFLYYSKVFRKSWNQTQTFLIPNHCSPRGESALQWLQLFQMYQAPFPAALLDAAGGIYEQAEAPHRLLAGSAVQEDSSTQVCHKELECFCTSYAHCCVNMHTECTMKRTWAEPRLWRHFLFEHHNKKQLKM